jgi:cystathionine gamma-lyase
MKFTTRALHAGTPKDPQTDAVTFPIYQTSTYGQDSPGKPTRFQDRELNYGRGENPTRTALEQSLAALEDAKFALAFSSGLAAVAAVMNTLKAGDHVVACQDLYGGCYRMFTKVYAKLGIEYTFVDATCLQEIEDAFRDNTALLWLESPSNPLINITDISGATAIARRRGAKTIVDNTFATPYLQQPLSLGADLVLHSTTKYINGHADVLGGALITNEETAYNDLKFVQTACGFIPGPQDCFLISRGLRTLALRMERHSSNAMQLASWLAEHPKVSKVFYPGLTQHPGHELAGRQMKAFGGMLSFEIRGDIEAARAFLENLRVFTLAESLGAIQSLANHPASMTHASMEPHVRESVGISDGLIRLSVGIEDVEDLVADLDGALSKA